MEATYSKDGKTLIQAPKYAERFDIPSTVESIDPFAFSESIHLKKIVIPPTVKRMRMNPFWGCGAKIQSESDEFVIIGEGLYSSSKRSLIHCFTHSDTFRVADGTEEIGACAFFCYMGDYCDTYKARGEVILPASVKKVDSWAFNECCLQRLVVNGKIDDLYSAGFVETCAFQEINVPHGLGDYYRKLWYGHRECITER